MKRTKKLSPKKKLRKESMEFWNERNEEQTKTDSQNKEAEFSTMVIENQKELAKSLQKMRQEYIEKRKREPDLTEYEIRLTAKYCQDYS